MSKTRAKREGADIRQLKKSMRRKLIMLGESGRNREMECTLKRSMVLAARYENRLRAENLLRQQGSSSEYHKKE